jgi:hypothetical protein
MVDWDWGRKPQGRLVWSQIMGKIPGRENVFITLLKRASTQALLYSLSKRVSLSKRDSESG